jgi:hypothetical protein
MVNAAHLTKLDAVNEMLLSIGETPVQSLGSGLQDASIAESVLDRTNRIIQLKGWHVNTRRNIELTKNASDQFAVGIDTLKIDTVNPSGGRQFQTPGSSGYINASLRRSADNTMFLLYDVDNDSETWPNDTTLTVDIVSLIDFAKLTPSLQVYVAASAGRRFQKGAVSSRVLDEFTREDVQTALIDAVQEDMENSDINMLRDNAATRNIVHRYNPNYGN